MKIAIEGMDGVGKTTVAKQLAERNNFRYVGNAIHKLFGIEDRESEIFMKKEGFIGECKFGEENIV